jgi:hypothetical protein
VAKQQVWEARSLTLDYELTGSGAGAVTFQQALPGAALANFIIPSPGAAVPISARTTQSWPLAGSVFATYQVEVAPSATSVLKLFGGHLEARPIGEFYDGARGEKYTSTVITPGMGG